MPVKDIKNTIMIARRFTRKVSSDPWVIIKACSYRRAMVVTQKPKKERNKEIVPKSSGEYSLVINGNAERVTNWEEAAPPLSIKNLLYNEPEDVTLAKYLLKGIEGNVTF